MQARFVGELFERHRIYVLREDIEQLHHALDDLDGFFGSGVFIAVFPECRMLHERLRFHLVK